MPATVIDALVITLGLDAEQFLAGMKKTRDELKKTDEGVHTHGQNMEDSSKRAADGFKKLTFEILGMMGVVTSIAGVGAFVKNVTETDAAVGRLSKTVGVNTNTMSAWKLVADKFGGKDTGYCAFTEKLREHALIRHSSYIEQKVSGGTWGAIIRYPVAIAQMLGI